MNKTRQNTFIITCDLEDLIIDNDRKYDKRDTDESFGDGGSGENSFMTYGDYYDTFFDQEVGTLTLRKQLGLQSVVFVSCIQCRQYRSFNIRAWQNQHATIAILMPLFRFIS